MIVPQHPVGVSRRELLQVGFSGLAGLGLASTIRAGTAQSPGSKQSPKSVIVVFLTGAMSHIDTFDPKPDAVVEVRGQYGAISTKVPGYQVGELLPKMAARADKYAVVRSLAHTDNNHTAATHHIITGSKQPGVRFDKPLSRDDWPVFASGLSFLKPRHDGVPTGVTLPTFLAEGPLVWPGQHAGFLGPKHDPWQLRSDPNGRDFKVDNVAPVSGLEIEQLNDRMALLEGVNRQQRVLAESLEGKRLTEQQQKAMSILTSGKVAKAFEIHKESAATRDKYGRHMFGQSLLLARRLVEAGVSVVQANMGRVQNWDHHGAPAPAPEIVEYSRDVLALIHAAALARNIGWWEPHIGCNERGQVTLEWWHNSRTLTLFIRSSTRVDYLKSWGTDIDTEMEDGEVSRISDFLALSGWLYQESAKMK